MLVPIIISAVVLLGAVALLVAEIVAVDGCSFKDAFLKPFRK